MIAQSKLQALIEWFHSLRNVFCPHDIVPMFTMESILEDKWERISGSGQCRKCGEHFTVSIAKDETEQNSEHYLGGLYR